MVTLFSKEVEEQIISDLGPYIPSDRKRIIIEGIKSLVAVGYEINAPRVNIEL